LPVLKKVVVDPDRQPAQGAESLHIPAPQIKIKQEKQGNKQNLGDSKCNSQNGYLKSHYPDNGFI